MLTTDTTQDRRAEQSANDTSNSRAVNLGLFSNIILAFLKVIFGITGHSPALLADGINSTSDVVYYIAAKISLRISVEPADSEHPFGHRQMENIAAIIVGSFILSTAVAIFWNSINSIYEILINRTVSEKSPPITLVIALSTVLIKIFLTIITRNIGKKTGNSTIRALAFDHLNDVFASFAAAMGIYFSRHGFSWVDPLAGGVVALFILRTGIGIIRESAYGLMDTAPGAELKEQVISIAGQIPGIIGVEKIRTHRFGQFIVLYLDICLEGSLTITRGDAISDLLESRLLGDIVNLVDVHIHYHPVKNIAGCSDR